MADALFIRLEKISPLTFDLGFFISLNFFATLSQFRVGRERSRASGISSRQRQSNSELMLLKWSATLSATSLSESLGKRSRMSNCGVFLR